MCDAEHEGDLESHSRGDRRRTIGRSAMLRKHGEDPRLSPRPRSRDSPSASPGEAEAAIRTVPSVRVDPRALKRRFRTHGHSIGIFPSDLLALGLPLLERVLLLVLELHRAPLARGRRGTTTTTTITIFLDPSIALSSLARPFRRTRARALCLSLVRSARRSQN